MDNSRYVFDHEQVKAIRHALLIGLTSFGEIERLTNACEIGEASGEKVPEELRALHPTGAADTTSVFATALCFLEHPIQQATT